MTSSEGTSQGESRQGVIEARLREAFDPTHLDVEDESHMHAGHAGARDGRGHFRVEMVSAAFAGKNRVARHRLVYSALGELMETDIHALAVKALTPEEWSSR